jgi:hypothetical protein
MQPLWPRYPVAECRVCQVMAKQRGVLLTPCLISRVAWRDDSREIAQGIIPPSDIWVCFPFFESSCREVIWPEGTVQRIGLLSASSTHKEETNQTDEQPQKEQTSCSIHLFLGTKQVLSSAHTHVAKRTDLHLPTSSPHQRLLTALDLPLLLQLLQRETTAPASLVSNSLNDFHSLSIPSLGD